MQPAIAVEEEDVGPEVPCAGCLVALGGGEGWPQAYAALPLEDCQHWRESFQHWPPEQCLMGVPNYPAFSAAL